MTQEFNKRVAYVVLSCDPYCDIWDTYGELFNRHWPDCPYDFYLASHQKPFEKYGFKPILIGEDKSWSHGLLTVLHYVQEKGYSYVMIAFDDFLISKKVDTEYVSSAINTFVREGGECLRFDPIRTARCFKYSKYYGKMHVKVPYRVTLGFTLWNIEVLKKLTVDGESAWQFEKNATERSFEYKDFFCTWKHPFNFINLINKRKLDIAEYHKLKKLIPNAKYDREQVFVVKERLKGYLLCTFLRFYPVKHQYTFHKFFTKPINI